MSPPTSPGEGLAARPVVRRTYGRPKANAMVEDPDSSMTLMGTPSLHSYTKNASNVVGKASDTEEDYHIASASQSTAANDSSSPCPSPVKAPQNLDWKAQLAAVDESDDEADDIRRDHVTSFSRDASSLTKSGNPSSHSLAASRNNLKNSSLTTLPDSSQKSVMSTSDLLGESLENMDMDIDNKGQGSQRRKNTSSSRSKTARRSQADDLNLSDDEDHDAEPVTRGHSPPLTTTSGHSRSTSTMEEDHGDVDTTQSKCKSIQPTSRADSFSPPPEIGRANSALRSKSASAEPRSNSEHPPERSRKTRAPSKKEQKEAILETARLRNEHSTTGLKRTDIPSQYTASAFLQKWTSRIPSAHPAELSSDPIQSSPVKQAPAVQPDDDFGEALLLAGPSNGGRGNLFHEPPRNRTPELSDDELPTVSDIVQKGQGKDKQALLAEKKKQLAKQAVTHDDSDSDLEVMGQSSHSLKIPQQRPINGRRQPHLASTAPPLSSKTVIKGKGRPLTQAEHHRSLLKKVEEDNQRSRKMKETDWQERGGHLKVAPVQQDQEAARSGPSKEVLDKLAQQALKNEERDVGKSIFSLDNDEDNDVNDGDWAPEDDSDDHEVPQDSQLVDSGSESPSSPRSPARQMDVDADRHSNDVEDENDGLPRARPARSRNRNAIVNSDEETENDENMPWPTPRPNLGRTLVPNSTAREGVFFDRPPRPRTTSQSSDILSDDANKENDGARMFDQSDDKENKTVPRHAVTASSPTAHRPALLARHSSTSHHTPLGTPGPSQPRTPLAALPDMEDPFDSPSLHNKNSFLERLRASQSPTKPTSDSPRPVARRPIFSQFMDDSQPVPVKSNTGLSEFMDDSQPVPVKPKAVFSQFMDDSQVAPAGFRGGLQDAFDEFDSPGTGPSGSVVADPFAGMRKDDSPNLTLSRAVPIEPGVDLSSTAVEQANGIFNKDQEILGQSSTAPKATQPPAMFENTQGFLTQTKPLSRATQSATLSPMLPTQTFTQLDSARKPLSVLSFTQEYAAVADELEDQESTLVQPLRRIRRQRTPDSSSRQSTPSASPPRNAFTALQHGAQKAHSREKKAKKKLDKSDFVEGEAVESDEDAGFGFGPKDKADADDHESGNDEDKVVEGLVDDAHMDAETEAADLVQEKFQEQQEEDDQRLEKIAQDAIGGKMRTRKRQGLGIDDSESESDDEAHVQRVKSKKRKVEGDTLEAMRHTNDQAAFVKAYDDGINDDHDELAFLEKPPMDSLVLDDSQETRVGYEDEYADDHDADEEIEERRQPLTTSELNRKLREAAQEPQDERGPQFDPNNTEWMDQDGDEDEDMQYEYKAFAAPAQKRPVRHDDLDNLSRIRRGSAREQAQHASWMKGQSSHVSGASRSTGGASVTVTGHGRKSATPAVGGVKKAGGLNDRRGTGSKSMLASVSSLSRKDKFA